MANALGFKTWHTGLGLVSGELLAKAQLLSELANIRLSFEN